MTTLTQPLSEPTPVFPSVSYLVSDLVINSRTPGISSMVSADTNAPSTVHAVTTSPSRDLISLLTEHLATPHPHRKSLASRRHHPHHCLQTELGHLGHCAGNKDLQILLHLGNTKRGKERKLCISLSSSPPDNGLGGFPMGSSHFGASPAANTADPDNEMARDSPHPKSPVDSNKNWARC